MKVMKDIMKFNIKMEIITVWSLTFTKNEKKRKS